MVSAAKPTLTRFRKLAMYMIRISGTSRQAARRRIASASARLSCIIPALCLERPPDRHGLQVLEPDQRAAVRIRRGFCDSGHPMKKLVLAVLTLAIFGATAADAARHHRHKVCAV